MLPHERLAFSAIEGRPPLKLPDGLRLILWPLMSLEQWDISRPMARMVITPPQGQAMLPDHPNWSWHEYGMRVGFWRLKRVFERLKMTPTVTVNGRACEAYPSVIQAVADAGWELNAHSYDQMPMHKLDDEPVTLKTTGKPIVALPYNFELHDIVMMALQNHPSGEMYRRSMDAFECLYAESKDRAKIMSIAVHPFLSGQTHRIKYVEQAFEEILSKPGVACWSGEQILDWYLGTQKDKA